ncbi:MAG: LuxR C-terminal-related transcriptional regulator [Bacteroidota bacterium]
MNLLQKLVSIIEHARAHSIVLNLDETMQLFDAVKHITTDRHLVEKVIHLTTFSKNQETQIKNLSKRESEIFKLIGLGFSSREISDLLQISEATVSTHRKKMIKKLNLSGAGRLQKMSLQYIQNNFSD